MHPLDGARERLKRAYKNIQNLDFEIGQFVKPAPVVLMAVDPDTRNPIITDENRQAYEQLIEFIKTRTVDPAIRVLAGEIIHHLRSAFDHVTWQLSSAVFQEKYAERIDFPVCKEQPVCGIKKKEICRFCRKVEGISSPTALARIDLLQPYRGDNPSRHPLWLIHDMDRIDKHRELILSVNIMKLKVFGNAILQGWGNQMPWEIRPRNVRYYGEPKMHMEVQMAAEITLGEFRGRDDESIIPTLNNLLRFTTDAIEGFAGEFA